MMSSIGTHGCIAESIVRLEVAGKVTGGRFRGQRRHVGDPFERGDKEQRDRSQPRMPVPLDS